MATKLLYLSCMGVAKSIISFFLLLTYTLGSAYSIIPHCHPDEIYCETEQHYHHQHHQHSENDSHCNGNHILHNDHFDEGIYDLIVCFLSEYEHPVKDCLFENCVPAKSYNLLKSYIGIAAVTYSPLATNAVIPVTIGDKFGRNNWVSYSLLLLTESPFRGPPSLSC